MTIANENRIVETVEELDALDWEVPGMPEFSVDDAENHAEAIIETFEGFNKVQLEGDALAFFKNCMKFFYGT